MSPVRAHQARVLASLGGRVMASMGAAPPRSPAPANDDIARREAQPAPAPGMLEARAYQEQLAQLGVDERRLKSIQSIERKIAAKREMLPAYAPWVEGRLAAVEPVQDAVVATVMVWRMDVGDWDGALAIADHVLRHGLRLPARFTRSPPTVIAEEVADAACAAHQRGEDFPLQVIARAGAMTAEADIPDEVRARLHKAAGQQLAREADDDSSHPRLDRAAALAQLHRARELDARAGVGGLIQRLEREQKKEPAA